MNLPNSLFILVLVCCSLFIFAGCAAEMDKSITTTVQVIQSYGYPVEVHTVETKDGYLLEMHRIPPRVTNGTDPEVEKRRKFPIVYSNALLGSSADMVLLGPGRSLVFLLSDLGFDVWLGNYRGNTYSRAHTRLSPNDRKFWDFSWHESGVYDLPAQIDYVCNETKAEKVIVVGYSMGTTAFFVMASSLPEYNEKIEMALMMAPVAYLENQKSPLISGIIPFRRLIKTFEDIVANGEFLSHSQFLQAFSKFVCTMNRIEERLCESIIFLATGADPQEFDEDMLSFYLNFFPAGYSVKGVYHYSQLVESGEFREYDYGLIENMLRYNSVAPPNYNLSAITAEMHFYVGPNDYLGDPTDAKRLAKQLPSLKKFRMVDFPQFNHLDFAIGQNAKEELYDFMIKDIQAHINELENKA